MHQTLLTVAIIGYVAATGLALAYLVQREELLHRLAALATLTAWVLHTVALLTLAIDLGRPPLASRDRLTDRTLAFGFPFLTTGLILGVLWAGTAWGSVFTFDPLALSSYVAWAVYAATLAGRAAGGWHGRRAAYFALVGFAVLALTLGAGLFL